MQQHSLKRKQLQVGLLFLPYPFKGCAIHLVVHELSIILVSLDPETRLRIIDLAAFTNSSNSVAVTDRWILCHITFFLLLSGG